MYYATWLLLLVSATCFAHSSEDNDNHNFFDRLKQSRAAGIGELVECPVCVDNGDWIPSREVCTVEKDSKKYKVCRYGTYINEKCGNRLDCYRGGGEQCTEKMFYDLYGQRCGPGYYCNKPMAVCQGIDYEVDILTQYLVNPFPYPLDKKEIKEYDENKFLNALRN